MQEHRVPGIHSDTMYCGSSSNHSRKEVNVSVTAAFRDESRQEEIMCPIFESGGHNLPFHDDSDDSVYNNIQSQQDEQLKLKTLQRVNAETMMQYLDFQYHTGFLPENAMEMPLPPQFQLPSKHSLNMHGSN